MDDLWMAGFAPYLSLLEKTGVGCPLRAFSGVVFVFLEIHVHI